MQAKHVALHAKLTDQFPSEVIIKWETNVIAWEAHDTRKNPYEEADTGVAD
jgi:hypothetical protein